MSQRILIPLRQFVQNQNTNVVPNKRLNFPVILKCLAPHSSANLVVLHRLAAQQVQGAGENLRDPASGVELDVEPHAQGVALRDQLWDPLLGVVASPPGAIGSAWCGCTSKATSTRR